MSYILAHELLILARATLKERVSSITSTTLMLHMQQPPSWEQWRLTQEN